MLHVPPHDNALVALLGATLPSETQPGVTYALERMLGGGAMSVVFAASRVAPEGRTAVVLKVLRPALAQDSGGAAVLSARKETASLRRLNERTPPPPFVVRLIDAGTVLVHDGRRPLELPWTALEYVHGGIEGTTLEERVDASLRATGSAFDRVRAANAIACLAQGLVAIHEVGVVHRDLKPTNVLCCGFGVDEILKVADFGIARLSGAPATFGGLAGTPGYSAPEQIVCEEGQVGPHSDVFALGAVVYYLLTGAAYFPVDTPAAAVAIAHRPERRRLAEAGGLSPELRARPAACASLDATLARLTAPNPDHRPRSADVALAMLLPALRAEAGRGRTTEIRTRTLIDRPLTRSGTSTWTFCVRHRPGDERVVRSVAWDSDGRCLAATSQGLAFWTGTGWQRLAIIGLPAPERLHFVRRGEAGEWLLGGDGASIHAYHGDAVTRPLVGRDPAVRFVLASGDLSDLAVFVGEREGEPPTLYTVAAGHWVKPAALTRAATITSLAQLDEERWIVTGGSTAAEGIAVVYTPLEWEVKRLRTPPARVYLCSATRPELGLGLIGGTGGRVLRFHGDTTQGATLEGEPPVSAVALDPEGRAWAASLGQLWTMDPGEAGAWRAAWRDPHWAVPFVSISADAGRVIAMTADGGIVEGRCELVRGHG